VRELRWGPRPALSTADSILMCYQKLGRAETRSGAAISGMHEQNMQSACAYHPPCCRGVPRIFLTASYAAIALDHL
jgi:hypothetical protein